VTAPREQSAWAPFHVRIFRMLWIAQFTSNVGTWMQTVGAQWLMGSLSHDPLFVALVQTAISLPVFLLALPSGALGDVFDRRRILLVSQSFMLAGAATLGALTAADDVTPWVLLGLTFAIGAGQAMTAPSWQAIQPELVGRELIPQASALGATSMNLARAVGPAIGGALVATVGAEATFFLNAVSFLAVLAVVFLWRREAPASALGAEQVRGALRAGTRYVRSSPRLRAVLARTIVFVAFGAALWALLPVVVRRDLHLGSGGYGLLLGCVGVGAVAGAQLLPALRERFGIERVVIGGTVVYALASAVLGWVHIVAPVAIALVGAGVAWIAVVSSFNATAQTVLPNWVRARGMAIYLLTFQGGQALGAFVWGLVAQQWSTRLALSVVSGGMLVGVSSARRYGLRPSGSVDMRPAQSWAEPHLMVDPSPGHGPVLVEVEYRVPKENRDAFREEMIRVGRSRRRTGAQRWHLYQDGADPERFVETYVVPTWQEHLRQHGERVTRMDREIEERARALAAENGAPRVSHLFSAYGGS
jgi:MFS family permease/quinol monooxygenase YgiN